MAIDILAMLAAYSPHMGVHIDLARVLLAGPRPRGRWHMLTHRKRRMRKKWAKRLAPVRRAESEWSRVSGLILDHGRLYAVRGSPLAIAWPPTRIEADRPSPWLGLGGLTMPLLIPHSFITSW